MPVGATNDPSGKRRFLRGKSRGSATEKCPEYGIPGHGPAGEKNLAKRTLAKSYIKAAYKVLAEERAIGSGTGSFSSENGFFVTLASIFAISTRLMIDSMR